MLIKILRIMIMQETIQKAEATLQNIFLEHCLAIEIGNPSHPALELVSDLITHSDTSSITILFETFLT